MVATLILYHRVPAANFAYIRGLVHLGKQLSRRDNDIILFAFAQEDVLAK